MAQAEQTMTGEISSQNLSCAAFGWAAALSFDSKERIAPLQWEKARCRRCKNKGPRNGQWLS
jgi:hypothetical protein